MKLRRLNTKTYGRSFRKRQDYLIPKMYRIIKSNFNNQLQYVNDLLLDTKNITTTLARLDRRKLTDMNTEMLVDIWTKVGLDVNEFIINYVEYEKKKFTSDPKFINLFLENLVYQLSERGANIADTSIGRLTAIIQQAAIDGLSISETSKLLRREFNRLNVNRSKLIARTETISASNRGSIKTVEMFQQDYNISFKKIWLATGGTRTRPEHSAASGQTVEMDQNFIVWGEELEYPGDIGGSCKNICNCRCTVIYEENE